MTALNVWTYSYVEGARRLEQRLGDGTVGDLVVMDGALVTWLPGRSAPLVRELQGTARTDSLGVGFWGLLFGIVVSGPDLATLAGDSRLVLDGSLTGVGADREFLADLRGRLRPGCSAVAVICPEGVAADIDRVSRLPSRSSRPPEALPPGTTQKLLTNDEEDALRQVFSA